MMKHVLFTLLYCCVCFIPAAAQVKLGFLAANRNIANNREVSAAFDFARSLPEFDVHIVEIAGIKDKTSLSGFTVLWYHETDSAQLINNGSPISAVAEYFKQGGNILLTGEAARWINLMGIEKNDLEVRHKAITDKGYGRIAGFRSFREHPLFDGLNGGAYICRPPRDTVVRLLGFFDSNIPAEGKTVAVDWDYIFVNEQSKVVLHYRAGRGNLLAAGGYLYFSHPNSNKKHLELFTQNALKWLQTGKPAGNYWSYGKQQIRGKKFTFPMPAKTLPSRFDFPVGLPEIEREKGGNHFWDVTGERVVVMGKENSGIEEVWTHPFMVFRDMETGLLFEESDTITWLKHQAASIRVDPVTFQRVYRIGKSILTETIFCDPELAAAIIHYELEGERSADLLLQYRSNMRLMWPYSGQYPKLLNYEHNSALNGIFIMDGSNSFCGMLGSNKPVTGHFEGQYSSIASTLEPAADKSKIVRFSGATSDDFMLSGIIRISLSSTDQLDIVIAGSDAGLSDCIKTFGAVMQKPEDSFKKRHKRGDIVEYNLLRIESPDGIFNAGFAWAKHSTDAFFVHTPGLGKSLVAGYGTTGTGWDGGHSVNGRPGYAWYFGRDGVWSGFALLHYGDFRKVKSMLELFNRYQDVNGKIFHELTTTGFAHYDAADATPLYITLAGRYLRHSGDSAFIRSTWEHIQAAIGFCFSTDTDNDHLIENTNVGHGWVEGGSLFGSHSSLYLSACWAEALKEAAYMAKALNMEKAGQRYQDEYVKVKEIIEKEFHNPETGLFYHGKFRDGTMHTEPTIMPAIPLLFEQITPDKADTVLNRFAGFDFTADWGCRIIRESSPLFNPKGYHTGSVWPLFTGWASLAEYRYGRPVQGFSHLYGNMMIHKDWGLGFTEEVLHGEKYEPSGVCSHQCWSGTMAMQPAMEGMLGLKYDALKHSLELAPQFPADWDSVKVSNIRTGNHLIHFTMNRTAGKTEYTFKHNGQGFVDISLKPGTLPEMMLTKLHYFDGLTDTLLMPENELKFRVLREATVTYEHKGGISVLPMTFLPEPGDVSKGPRIVSEGIVNGAYQIQMEGLKNTEATIQVYSAEAPVKFDNCSLAGRKERINDISVVFGDGDKAFTSLTVRIYPK